MSVFLECDSKTCHSAYLVFQSLPANGCVHSEYEDEAVIWEFRMSPVIIPKPRLQSVKEENNLSSKTFQKKLYRFCFNSLCDWPRKLAPPARPIRSKTEINHDLVARLFPRFWQFVWLFRISSQRYFPLLWLVVVIALRHMCSSKK